MPLKVIIVGAGIAGLCAGVSLRQAGHEVEIFEKSAFATEVGAALMITPNGARVLSSLGFSFTRARAVQMDRWTVLRGDNNEQMTNVDLSAAEERFGAPVWAVHRVDLHNELLRLAMLQDGPGRLVKLNLDSEVIGAEVNGTIILKNGSRYNADLVVGADGLRSALKGIVLPKDATQPTPTGLSAFRFLIDTEILKSSESLSVTLNKKGPGASLLADVQETTKERHMMWYACRDGTVQNFVGIHPSRDVNGDDPDAVKLIMLDEFSQFSSEILDIIRKSSDVKCWPLLVHKPLSSWSNGRILLIGDAAHPMLPFGGQGSNSAIEDGGALGYFLNNIDDASVLPAKLQLFEKSRHARTARIQVLSSVRAGREKEVEEELRRYSDPPGSRVPSNMIERTVHDYSFDVFKKCEEVSAKD